MMERAEFNPDFPASYVACEACPRFWAAPAGRDIVGRCRLRREWLTETRRCARFEIEMEERRQRFRRETAGTGEHGSPLRRGPDCV